MRLSTLPSYAESAWLRESYVPGMPGMLMRCRPRCRLRNSSARQTEAGRSTPDRQRESVLRISGDWVATRRFSRRSPLLSLGHQFRSGERDAGPGEGAAAKPSETCWWDVLLRDTRGGEEPFDLQVRETVAVRGFSEHTQTAAALSGQARSATSVELYQAHPN